MTADSGVRPVAEAVGDECSFLLLKPDCLEQGLGPTVEAEIAAATLNIRCRHRITLTPSDVRYLWTEYNDRDHVLALGFLDRYLCGGPSEVVCLGGAGAFEIARKLKRSIRGQYARGVFANVVHAAETRSELVRQAGRLLGVCSRCLITWPACEVHDPPLRPPGLAFADLLDVQAVIAKLWPRVRAGLIAPNPVRLGSASAEAAVFLGVDSDNSLDSAVTAVWHALPGIDLGDALIMTLYAGRSGGHAIALGAADRVSRCHDLLREHGIRNTWIGPPPAGPVTRPDCRA